MMNFEPGTRMMNSTAHRRLTREDRADLERLFREVFSESEGPAEGGVIGALADGLAAALDDENVFCFGTKEGEELVSGVFFTRLRFPGGEPVMMLAPMAVRRDRQGRGIGQAVIAFALEWLRERGIAVVVTYGDIRFYRKAGFAPLSEEILKAPMPLSMPEGWLGQSLNGGLVSEITGKPVCVPQFQNPVYW